MNVFRNRAEAGRELGRQLAAYAGRDDVVVLALPRGGVPVAFEVAVALHARLDVFVVRKLGTPGQRELAMGAIAPGGVRVLNEEVVNALRIAPEVIEQVTIEQQREMERRLAHYGQPAIIDAKNRIALIVDDGLATGSTMKAAVMAVRQLEPARVVVAVPVGAPDTCRALERIADDVVCVSRPEPFSAVGQWYLDFHQVSDDEIRDLLALSRHEDH
jgi:predicted phosphoribosyltransferase